MKRILLISFVLMAALISESWAQDRTISGRVTSDEDGSGLPGVNVILKGTTTGTTTDIDGNYKLAVPQDGGTLTFSFIGLAPQEVAIGARSTIDIEMSSDVKQLTEVVVTAIGIEREKKALGYAVSDVSGDALKQRAEPDPIRALTGKVPGVNIVGAGGGVGQATNITIRGSSSLTGNNQPLFVVDGVPFDNSVTRTNDDFRAGNPQSNRAFDIDPNNIETMTVLKGASAAALYGSRAANGVIVITTKAAARGEKKGLEVTFNTSYNVEQNAMNLDKQDEWAQGATFGSNNFVWNNGFFGTWGPKYDWVNEMIQQGFPTDGILGNTLGGIEGIRHPLFRKYGSNPSSPLYAGDQYPFILDFIDRAYADDDNFNNFWQDGSVVETAVQINSGGENTSLTAGVSRTNNEGIIPFSEITRTSMNFGGRAQLANGLFLNGSITYVNTEQRTAAQGAEISAGAAAGTSIIGMLYLMSPTYDLTNNPYVNNRTGGSIYYRNGFDNPYWVAEFAPILSNVNRYFGNATVGYEVFDWLTVTYKFGFNAYTDRRSSLVPAGGENIPAGEYAVDDVFREELDGNLLVTIEKDLSADINFRALVGHNANQRTFEQTTIVGNGIIARGIDRITNTSSQLMRRDYGEIQRFQGVFADLSVSYRDWAFLNVVGRNDWSSTLPEDNRSFFYPGVSASVVLSEAVTLPSVINFAKVRAGITQVGNEAAPYQTQTPFLINDQYANLQFPFATSRGTFNIANQDEDLGSPTLKPEFTTEYEVGMEVTLLNNKIGLDVTYYNRQSTDQIIEVTVPSTTGYRNRITNIGRVDNFGWEIGLDLTPVELSNGFKWNIYTAYTRNRNEVIDIGDAEQILVGGYTNQGIVHRPGLPFGQILGTDVQRDAETGEVLVNPASGKPFETNDLQVIGDPNPNYTVGVTNSFSWKGISLSVLIDYQDGGEMFSLTADQTFSRGILNHPLSTDRVPRLGGGFLGDGAGNALTDESGNKIVNNVLIPANDWVFFDGWAAGGADWASVYDATTIRLREISLSYNFPTALLDKTPFGSARVSFSGRNLWYDAVNFPDALDFDPEVSGLGAGDTSGAFRGFDYMGIPSTRRYGVNLSVTF